MVVRASWDKQITEYSNLKSGTKRFEEATSAIEAYRVGHDYRGIICEMLRARDKFGCGRGPVNVSYEFVRYTALGSNRTALLPEPPTNATIICEEVMEARKRLGP